MKVIEVTMFEAYDGICFDSAPECQEYEAGPMLEHHISSNIHSEWSFDADDEVITALTVAQYITENWEFLKNVIQK